MIRSPTSALASLAAFGLAFLGLASPSTAHAQSLSGEWVEIYAQESASVASWGDNCGPRPKSGGRRKTGRKVTITEAGGVINIPKARVKSDRCQYVSAAKRVSYSGASGYVLTCSTPPGASPRESATYRFSASNGGNALTYKARVTAYWKLKGDVCDATLTYQRRFERVEPVKAEVVAEVVKPAEPPPKAKPLVKRPRKRATKLAKVESPKSEEVAVAPVAIPAEPEPEVEPPERAEAPVVTPTEPVDDDSGGIPWWVVVLAAAAAGVLTLAGLGFFLFRRGSQRQQTLADVASTAGPTRVDAPAASLASMTRTTIMEAAPPLRKPSEPAATVVMERSPAGVSAHLAHDRADGVDNAVSVRACPDCDRRFDVASAFCPFDGARLYPLEAYLPAADPDTAKLVCPQCGEEAEGAAFCAADGTRLVPKEPEVEGYVAVPLMICSTCQREFLHGTMVCPDDGTTLLPMVGRSTGGLPLTGFGPKSKICPECGTRYAFDATFCGRDGSSLAGMN